MRGEIIGDACRVPALRVLAALTAWVVLAAWPVDGRTADVTTATGTETTEPAPTTGPAPTTQPPASGAGVEGAPAPPPPASDAPPTGETPSAEPGENASTVTPSIVAGEGESPPPMPIPAVYFDRDIEFGYMGRTAYYTCDGLKSKVTQILRQMGVKPGFKVTIGSCFESGGYSTSGRSVHGAELMPTVRIRGGFPTEATPEVLEELQTTSAERDLLRRYQGLPTDFDPALDQFAAVRTVIVFKDGKLGPIDAGDCELIEAMRDKVFKPVGMRIIEDRMSCQPGQVSMGSVNMKVEILEQPQPAEAQPEKNGKKDKKKVSDDDNDVPEGKAH